MHNHPENTICGESCPDRREFLRRGDPDAPISAELPGDPYAFTQEEMARRWREENEGLVFRGQAEVYVRPLDPRAGNEFEHVGRVVEKSHRVLPERWVVRVCPLCNGQVEPALGFEAGATHTGDCPNRDKTFRVREIFVVPEVVE